MIAMDAHVPQRDGDGESPEGGGRQALAHRHPLVPCPRRRRRSALLIGRVVRQVAVRQETDLLGTVADAEGEGDADRELEGGDDQEGVSPVEGRDEPGKHDDHDAAGAGAHGHVGQRPAAAAAEPVGDGDHAHGTGGGAHADGDDDDGAVERPQVLDPAQQDEPQRHRDHAEDH